GYTSQRIMEIFREYGITSGVVSLGGNVQCYGTKPDGSLWRCGITDPDHPDDTSALSGVISVDDKAVITSGGYERYFTENGKTYHHIINPENGYPADSGLKSVTIVSADGTLADGLSTACFVMGKEKSFAFWREHPELFDMVLITNENEILVTEGLKENFSSRKDYTIIK
ncbi:MAG: FAD:protein FMN transferase, partial [Acutalibacteraceae bacterium]|nr:FAD:protein FMN transferase [Acutalibacteraceae bacterium]